MPEIKSQPKFLKDVVQAMVDLCERQGSSVEHIIDQVRTNIAMSNRRPKPRNVVMQVRRALRHGIETGLLRQQSRGRYKIFLSNLVSKSRIINSNYKHRLEKSRYFEATKKYTTPRLSIREKQKYIMPKNFKKQKNRSPYKYKTTVRKHKQNEQSQLRRRIKRRLNLGNRIIINKPKKQGPPGAICTRNVTMDGDKNSFGNKKSIHEKMNSKSFLFNKYNALDGESDRTDTPTVNGNHKTQVHESNYKVQKGTKQKESAKSIEPKCLSSNGSMKSVSELYRNEHNKTSPSISDRSHSYIV